MKQNRFAFISTALVLIFASSFASLLPLGSVEARQDIIFPVIGKSTYANDYTAPRANGPHHAIDIIADKGQQEVAADAGVITDVEYPEPSWGYSVTIHANNGYSYTYIHMNNDTPGTDDGKGGPMHAYAPDMKEGNRVTRGQLLGWVGDSGNAEDTVSHLHFEMRNPDGDLVNPYISLNHATHISHPATPAIQAGEIVPYGQGKLGISIAMANFDLDSQSELVTGAGIGGGPRVKVYESNNSFTGQTFYAYASSFKGGIDVAAGDVDGDGTDEIITGAGPGGSHVRVFEPNGTLLADFTPYGSFHGGIRVAAGDVDNNGTDEIITGAGYGGGPRVKVFELDGTPVQNYYAFDPSFKGGIDVASADVSGGLEAEVITSVAKGDAPRVRIWRNGAKIAGFYAYKTDFKGGVHVSAANVRTGLGSLQSEILTVPADGPPRLRLFGADGSQLSGGMFIEGWWRGPYDVAAGNGISKAATGTNRRASVRPGLN